MLRRVLRALILVAVLAAPARADLRFAHGNDAFTDLDPPVDDAGFTTDLSLAFWRPVRGYHAGGALLHRWVTERFPGRRRCDLVELVATGERGWTRGLATLIAGARLGPTFTGNLGGRALQNGWHEISKTGNTLDQGLQHDYVRGVEAGVVAGGRAHAAFGRRAQAYAITDAQLALATGVSSVEAALGGRVRHRAGTLVLGAHLEVAVQRFHVADDRLALTGGYRTGFGGAWRTGAVIAYRRFGIDFEYRANEGNSGEPIAVIGFTFKQAGTAF
jgi:hypothetical protein